MRRGCALATCDPISRALDQRGAQRSDRRGAVTQKGVEEARRLLKLHLGRTGPSADFSYGVVHSPIEPAGAEGRALDRQIESSLYYTYIESSLLGMYGREYQECRLCVIACIIMCFFER